MAKKQFQLTIKSVAALARNKRLRLAGVGGGGGSTTIVNGSGGSGGSTVSTLVTLITSGDGNAFTRATQSSDKLTITLYKDSTFLDEDTLVDVITELVGVLDGRFLRKDQDDSTPYSITIGGNLTVDKDGTFGGNVSIAKDGNIVGSLDVGKDVTIGENLDINGETTSKGVINAKDGVKFGEYTQGLLGSGGYIDAQGNGELGGLTLRNFLEVPELRFNRVSVIAGTQWQTAGQGLIEEVEVTGTYTGHCKLHLDEGEYGAIEEGDLCFGVFHNFEDTSQNYTGDDDDSQTGDFLFKGFCSVYFRITSVNDDHSEFDYELRNDGSWQFFHHPQPQMTFAGYGNAYSARTERQKCIYSTLTYTLFCESVTTWNFGKENIYMILGKLDGFTVQGTEISGDGAYLRNAFISGSIVQISNMPFVMTFSDTLAWVVNKGETDTITCKISKLTQDVTSEFSNWTAKIEGGASLTISSKGVITATYDELFATGDSVMVDVTATHTDSGEVVNDSFVVRKFDESKDGLSIIQSADSVTFNDDNNSYDFSIEVLRGNVHDAITSPTYSGVPTGVSISNINNSNGVYSFTLTRTDTSVNISGKITISITVDSVTYTRYLYLLTAVDGEDAVYIEAPDLVWANGGDFQQYFNVYAYKGSELVQLTTSNTSIKSNTSLVTVSVSHPIDYGIELSAWFTRESFNGRVALNSTAEITVTIDGVAYTKSINLTAVYDGDDAIQLSSTSEVLVWKTSSDVDRYFFLQLRKGNELIEFSSSDITIKSKPTGVNIDLLGYFANSGFEIEATFTGVLSNTELDDLLEFEVTSNNVTYTKQIRCVAVYDGQDAAGIAIDIPMQDIAIKGTCNQDIDCRIYVNNEIYPITRSAIKVDDSQISGPFGFTCEGVFDGMIQFNYYCLVYGGSYPLDAIIPVTFTVNGINFVRNFHMYTVFDGSASEKGDDAVVYELDCSVSTIHYQAAAGAFAPSSVTCSLYKVTGNYREEYENDITVYAQFVGSDTWMNVDFSAHGTITFTPTRIPNYGYPSAYRITATTPQGDIEKIINVTNSCAIRVHNWEDIKDDFDFESGQIGETFYDFVAVNNNGTLFYYQCIKSHTKFSGEEVTNTEYWKQVNSFDAVATNLLLAGTAKIDNLYVDDVYMEDEGKTTAIWVNPLFKGMKILNYGALGGVVGRENQVEDNQERDCWANPTAWFHGDSIPSTQNIYGSTVTGWQDGSIIEHFNFSLWNNPPSATTYQAIDFEVLGYKEINTSDLSSNDLLSITFLADTKITFTRGSASQTEDCWRDSIVGISLDFCDDAESSSLRRRNILFTQNMVVHNGYNGWNITQEITIPKGTSYTISVNGTSYFRYLRLVLEEGDEYNAYGADTLSVSDNFSLSLRIERKAYVSQYGADGVMVGITSKNFFRLGINEDDTMEHQMLSNGSGIILNSSGSKQIVEQISAPLGGLLLSGFLKVAGSGSVSERVLSANFWTWDAQEPNITYNGVGDYYVSLPSSWRESDVFSIPISNTAIAVTCNMNTEGKVDAIAYITEINSSCRIHIVCKELSGSSADVWGGLYIRVTYVGNMIAKSVVYGNTSSTSALAQARLLNKANNAKLLDEDTITKD